MDYRKTWIRLKRFNHRCPVNSRPNLYMPASLRPTSTMPAMVPFRVPWGDGITSTARNIYSERAVALDLIFVARRHVHVISQGIRRRTFRTPYDKAERYY